MLLTGHNRYVPLIVACIVFISSLGYFHKALLSLPVGRFSSIEGAFASAPPASNHHHENADGDNNHDDNDLLPPPPKQAGNISPPRAPDGSLSHVVLRSLSTPDHRYFPLRFGGHPKFLNPNILPHPSFNDTWIIVAQRGASPLPSSIWFSELVCNAQFRSGALACVEVPAILPIPATFGSKCTGDIEYYARFQGPRDARVFYGPSNPLATFGSVGTQTTCLAQWTQDFRLLVDWGYEDLSTAVFRAATELHRPDRYGAVEKNWFMFWDAEGNYYVHYDVAPNRVFAKLNIDGTVGPDLAPTAAPTDAKCLAARMPVSRSPAQAVHQATNSLSVTMCARAEADCTATPANTFIFVIFQQKTYAQFHSVYEPYVMMFRQTAPFELHAISTKPLWVYGRGGAGEGLRPPNFPEGGDWEQTEMFYVTSMSWKERGRKYHGHVDDVLLIAFGIEDERAGAIDILAGDLFAEMGLCAEVV
ncbi:hypothetical protein PZA11_006327 [Diplocarpon coronariae]|nr:hypothetical protein JHW43_005777 [Diplocarpon mali]